MQDLALGKLRNTKKKCAVNDLLWDLSNVCRKVASGGLPSVCLA